MAIRILVLMVCCIGALATGARAAAPQAVRWSAPATDVVETRDVVFENEGASLSGTLYLPRDQPVRGALVVTHGASSALRDRALYLHLREMLPPLGMAVLLYDRRGSGGSTGVLADSDYAVLARDALAGRRVVIDQLQLPQDRVGFWGLSQGGWLAMLAGSQEADAAFVISVSAPLVTPDVQMMFASESILAIKGYDDSEIAVALAARRAVDGHLRGELTAAEAQPLLDAAISRPWFGDIYMSPRLGDPATSRWLREMRHDPLTILPDLHAPTLLIYGAEDPWIPVEESARRFADLRLANPDISIAVLAGLDHAMMRGRSPAHQIDPEYMREEAPNAPAYFALITAWLTGRGFLAPSAPGRP